MPQRFRALTGLLAWAATLWWYWQFLNSWKPAYWFYVAILSVCTLVLLVICVPRLAGVRSRPPSSPEASDQGPGGASAGRAGF